MCVCVSVCVCVRVCVCACNCSDNRDMKRLITALNTTLQLQKQVKPGRPSSAALSSVPAADNDISDVAVVRAHVSTPMNLGVTFVKASPTVISVPPSMPPPDHVVDGGGYGSEPRFQLGASSLTIYGTLWYRPPRSTTHYL